MNARTARSRGLVYTGVYERSFNKEQLIERLNSLRREYPKAKFYQVDEDGGFSIYATPAYNAYQSLESAKKVILSYDERVRRAKETYEQAIANLDAQLSTAKALEAEAEATLAKVL